MKISYYCDISEVNWSVVSSLPGHLKRFDLDTETSSSKLRWFPEIQERDYH
jgi:hypothetical protein